jgi:pyruvate dehydrogenase E2 component (dihydrolipoamide acetyltransferase)
VTTDPEFQRLGFHATDLRPTELPIMAHAKSSDPNVFILPDLGEGVHEAELIAWKVKVGQTVAEHELLAEMQTDKALVEVPSPRAGTITALHGKAGEILKVGNPLVSYAGDAGAVSKPAAKPASENGSHAAPAAAPAPKQAQAKPAIPDEIPERTEDAGTVVGSMQGAAAGMNAAPGKALATPAVRRLARDLGVDIDTISGTGIGGRVTEKDVRSAGSRPAIPGRHAATSSFAASAAPAPAPAPAARPQAAPSAADSLERFLSSAAGDRAAASGPETSRIPMRGVRRVIAQRLRESLSTAVHFTVMDEADVAALDDLRRKLASASGEKVSFLPLVAAAVCRVLTDPRFAALNATMDEKPSDPGYEAAIVRHRAVHLGIAADTESGLMVPVIRDADRLGVLQIGREITRVATAARDRTIPREQLMGSTFTISNVGSHAGRFATPVINYPEVAILAVGRAREAVVVRNVPGFGQGMFPSKLLPLSLACDHRVVDGATAALALAEIVRLIQEPSGILG